MKKTNITIAILAIFATMGIANAAETTTTTTQYTQKIDESSTSSQRLILPENESDREIFKLLDARINSYADLRGEVSCTVQDGVVNLKGKVNRASQKDFAAMMATAVPGVIRVDNLISVK